MPRASRMLPLAGFRSEIPQAGRQVRSRTSNWDSSTFLSSDPGEPLISPRTCTCPLCLYGRRVLTLD